MLVRLEKKATNQENTRALHLKTIFPSVYFPKNFQ